MADRVFHARKALSIVKLKWLIRVGTTWKTSIAISKSNCNIPFAAIEILR
jgi:hypothetical protein